MIKPFKETKEVIIQKENSGNSGGKEGFVIELRNMQELLGYLAKLQFLVLGRGYKNVNIIH